VRSRLILLVAGGGAVLAGLGVVARPGARAPVAGDRILVVRGGLQEPAPIARAAPVASSAALGTALAAADDEFGDPGIWATPAEFDRPEAAD
jgi:hypothetical protein